jgi:hypothetical protein
MQGCGVIDPSARGSRFRYQKCGEVETNASETSGIAYRRSSADLHEFVTSALDLAFADLPEARPEYYKMSLCLLSLKT